MRAETTCREAAINLRQLRYFVAIAETGNITRAAEHLNVAQPALGLQIRQLEQDLKIELLRRHSRGVVLTEAGRLLLERARRILLEVEEARRDIKALSGQEQDLEILVLGMTPSIMLQIGPDILVDAKNELPGVALSLVEELSHVLMQTLDRGDIQIAFAYGAEEPRPGILRQPILEEELLFVTAATAQKLPDTLTLAEALNHDLVQAGERDMVQRLLKTAAEKFSLPLHIPYAAQSIPAMRTLVVRGAAASMMPYGTAIEELRAGLLVGRRISDLPVKRTLYLLTSANAQPLRHQAAIDAFLSKIADTLLASLGPLARRIR